MALTSLTRSPVVAREDPNRHEGLIPIFDFLHARQRNLEDERTREQTISLRFPARVSTRSTVVCLDTQPAAEPSAQERRVVVRLCPSKE